VWIRDWTLYMKINSSSGKDSYVISEFRTAFGPFGIYKPPQQSQFIPYKHTITGTTQRLDLSFPDTYLALTSKLTPASKTKQEIPL
jgi:hypothetical protein